MKKRDEPPYVIPALLDGFVRLVRNPGRPLGLLEIDDNAETAAHIQRVLEGARAREPKCSRELLSWVVRALREFRIIPTECADFIADGLERAIENPVRAGAAFGLVAKRQRPVSVSKIERDMKLAVAVWKLRSDGVALRDSRNSDGAYSRVAEAKNVSPGTVKSAYDSYRNFIKRFAVALKKRGT